jgi:hypothetical protein
MRLFQIGNRRNKILSDINSGRIKSPATPAAPRRRARGPRHREGRAARHRRHRPRRDPRRHRLPRLAGPAGAEAALTPDTADDADVARRVLAARQSIYDYEKARPGQFSDADITDAATQLKTARDAVDQTPTSRQHRRDQGVDRRAQAHQRHQPARPRRHQRPVAARVRRHGQRPDRRRRIRGAPRPPAMAGSPGTSHVALNESLVLDSVELNPSPAATCSREIDFPPRRNAPSG